MDEQMRDRILGCAVGAAVGDALGMPLEFGPPQPVDAPVRDMRSGRLPAGWFTDDTEMALALAASLSAQRPLSPADLARRFVDWYRTDPPDIGVHTRSVLARVAGGQGWREAVDAVQSAHPDSAGNGSVMRCWPVAVAYWDDLERLLADSRLQSEVTHPHAECLAGCAFLNAAAYHLFRGLSCSESITLALNDADAPKALCRVVEQAPEQERSQLPNSGWVRHTLQSAVWGLLTTHSFEEALIRVVNLGRDADSAGAVTGALAGAAYGLSRIPARWRAALRGEYPPGVEWDADRLIALAARQSGIG